VPEYQRLQRQVHELVGQVCGRHSSIEFGAPVIYLDQSMSHNDLTALYRVADVALITSLRDGMNLVSYEFVACHNKRDPPGVLILSEFAGAAQSLGAGSIRVNPWNLQETADAIYDALEMPSEERRALHSYAFQYINQHTAQKWAETFLQSLQDACSEFMEIAAEVPPLLPYEELLTDWSESTRRRLIILDLLDCLAPAKKSMRERRPRTQLSKELRNCLETLATSPDTTVVITTDKPRDMMENICWGLPVLQAAEGCTVYRQPGDKVWKSLVEEDAESKEWMEGVEAVFSYFKERTPGSYIEKQEYQYRWCWDNVQLNFGAAQAREVLIHLWSGPLVNSEAEVVVGEKWITVRPHSCSRRDSLERLMKTELGEEELHKLDFVLCFAAVSHRDEDVFEWCQNLIEDHFPWDESASRTDESDSSSVVAATQTSPTAAASGEKHLVSPREELLTPRGPPPAVGLDEPPPDYSWVPTAQRERQERLDNADGSEAVVPQPVLSVADPDEREARYYGSCYTLSLGMKKTKAQHALPHPYHVQNLIRAMASRVSRPASTIVR